MAAFVIKDTNRLSNRDKTLFDVFKDGKHIGIARIQRTATRVWIAHARAFGKNKTFSLGNYPTKGRAKNRVLAFFGQPAQRRARQ